MIHTQYCIVGSNVTNIEVVQNPHPLGQNINLDANSPTMSPTWPDLMGCRYWCIWGITLIGALILLRGIKFNYNLRPGPVENPIACCIL